MATDHAAAGPSTDQPPAANTSTAPSAAGSPAAELAAAPAAEAAPEPAAEPTQASETSREPRVIALGDSVIAGLGARGRSYAVTVAKHVGCPNILSLARSTFTVGDVAAQLPEVKAYRPDLVLVGVGGADGLVHTSELLQRIIDRIAPKSWQGVEGLEPRTYYSQTSRKKRIRQKITSRVKVTIKRVGLAIGDGYQRTPVEEYRTILRDIFAELNSIGCPVIVAGIVESDPKFFPKTPPKMEAYRDALKEESSRYSQFTYVDIRQVVDRWDDYLDDHTHLTPDAHDKVAELIITSAAPLLAGL